MSEDTPAAWDTDKVKLVAIDEGGRAILNHVPAWFGEACGKGFIRKAILNELTGDKYIGLEVQTPTKKDFCKVGDVIKNSPMGGLFVRHNSQEEKEPT